MLSIFKKAATLLTGAVLILTLASCSSAPSKTHATFKQTSFQKIPGWETSKPRGAFIALKGSCKKILNNEYEANVSKATAIGGEAIDWQVPCMEALKYDIISDSEAKRFFERWFTPYEVYNSNGDRNGLLTGYHKIMLNGSLTKTSRYKYPVYKFPKGMNHLRGTGYMTNEAINNGALDSKGLEIAYVDNRARLYLMHIQGSGVIKLGENKFLHLQYDGTNGYKFTGIVDGVKDYDLKCSSREKLYEYLHKNPTTAKKILEYDPSYVFFKVSDSSSAFGGHGTELIAERSLAVDYKLYPYGTPIWVSSDLNKSSYFDKKPYHRLFIAQDSGGAIKGPIRGGVYFGSDEISEKVSNNFRVNGIFFAFFPKTVKIPSSYSW